MKGRRHVHNTLTFFNRPYLQDIIFQDSKTDYDGGTGFEQVAENQDYEEETNESEAQRRWMEEKD